MMKVSSVEVRIVEDEWETPKKAVVTYKGWLEYKLRDGTVGLAQPKNWRYKGMNKHVTNV